jgi:hypothetical protein
MPPISLLLSSSEEVKNKMARRTSELSIYYMKTEKVCRVLPRKNARQGEAEVAVDPLAAIPSQHATTRTAAIKIPQTSVPGSDNQTVPYWVDNSKKGRDNHRGRDNKN